MPPEATQGLNFGKAAAVVRGAGTAARSVVASAPVCCEPKDATIGRPTAGDPAVAAGERAASRIIVTEAAGSVPTSSGAPLNFQRAAVAVHGVGSGARSVLSTVPDCCAPGKVPVPASGSSPLNSVSAKPQIQVTEVAGGRSTREVVTVKEAAVGRGPSTPTADAARERSSNVTVSRSVTTAINLPLVVAAAASQASPLSSGSPVRGGVNSGAPSAAPQGNPAPVQPRAVVSAARIPGSARVAGAAAELRARVPASSVARAVSSSVTSGASERVAAVTPPRSAGANERIPRIVNVLSSSRTLFSGAAQRIGRSFQQQTHPLQQLIRALLRPRTPQSTARSPQRSISRSAAQSRAARMAPTRQRPVSRVLRQVTRRILRAANRALSRRLSTPRRSGTPLIRRGGQRAFGPRQRQRIVLRPLSVRRRVAAGIVRRLSVSARLSRQRAPFRYSRHDRRQLRSLRELTLKRLREVQRGLLRSGVVSAAASRRFRAEVVAIVRALRRALPGQTRLHRRLSRELSLRELQQLSRRIAPSRARRRVVRKVSQGGVRRTRRDELLLGDSSSEELSVAESHLPLSNVNVASAVRYQNTEPTLSVSSAEVDLLPASGSIVATEEAPVNELRTKLFREADDPPDDEWAQKGGGSYERGHSLT